MDRNRQIEEASQVLDSVSFRTFWWPDNSVGDSVDVPEEGSFIQKDPRFPPSNRFIGRTDSGSRELEFDFTMSGSPFSVVSANELFDDGIILPRFFDPSILKAKEQGLGLNPEPHSPEPFTSGSKRESKSNMPSCFVSRQPTRALLFFRKYLNILRPLYWAMGRGGTKKGQATKSSVHPHALSVASSFSSISVSENLIQEAILHCKSSMSLS
ncbi:probable membrane-associated kinase regulator 6 [Punica granatum]|uniref:Uncharacterized protein n=2 Tax=Punica granatum TaxID=22663 RepID=A0A218WSH0_PUNGR|nr:probable membrane-associated kinase regulator 6 [Punica granatum]OWM75583.1 hypothetical protein CDL15_Pgr021747 [Punica granatum]PKI52103.1 hypothetical protein CRG98_027519 [Punica granatum]